MHPLRNLSKLIATAAFVLLVAPCTFAVGDAPWKGDLKWKYDAGFGITGTPVVSDGKVYVGDGEGTLHVVNAATGQLVWKFKGGTTINGAPALMDGSVFIGGRDGTLFALSAKDGSIRWEYRSGSGTTPGAIWEIGRASCRERV